MALIDFQRKLMEIGRLRIGQQVATSNGKTRPAKLDTWRFTSANETVIRQAATLYGGTPRPWEAPSGAQWELISEATTLAVLVPPADLAFTQFYELWSAGGCVRRCDGATETITDAPCLCDPDNRECKIHSRLSVLLSNLAGLGVWRVETSGWYAARELSAAVDVIRLAANSGQMLPAQLRLEQRVVKREGQTRRFAVPVLDIEVSPAQLLAGGTAFDPLAPLPAIQVSTEYLTDQGNVIEEVGRYSIANRMTPVPQSVPEHPTVAIEAPTAIPLPEDDPREQARRWNDPYEQNSRWHRDNDPIPAAKVGLSSSRATLATESLAPLTPVPKSVPEHPTASIAEQASKTRERKPRKGAAQPIPATGIKPRTAAQAATTREEAVDHVLNVMAHGPDARDFSEPQTPPEPKQISLDEPELLTPQQLTKLAILLKEAGFNDRDSKLAFCVAAINRTIASSKELTKDEASHLIDVLENNEPADDLGDSE